MNNYRYLRPNTAIDPTVRQIFTEQERQKISIRKLSEQTGLSVALISKLRHPDANGKHIRLPHLKKLAKAVGLKLTITVEKEGATE